MSSGGIFKTPLTTNTQTEMNTDEETSPHRKPIPTTRSNPHKIFTRKCNIILALIFLFVLAIALALGLTFSLRKKHHNDGGDGDDTNPSTPTPIPTNPTNASFWTPNLNSTSSNTWNINLLTPLNPSNIYANTTIYDIDLFLSANTTPAVIRTLHTQGHKVICYFSAGTIENFRPDTSLFQPSDYGSQLPDWPNEHWANISSPSVRAVMLSRLDLAANQSCDAVDPDNIDGYSNSNGLHLTQADSISYMQWLASEAHARGLAIGLKNGGEIINQVLSAVQFAVNEQCVQYDECATWAPFVSAGKPVFNIEYPHDAPSISQVQRNDICGAKQAAGFFTLMKKMDLDDWVERC
jgi:hypothetical protein